jgi:hypothetical protein
MLKDRANPLRPDGSRADPLESSAPCGRCGKMVAASTMLLWSESRRLRLPSETPGGFRYEQRDHHHAVCPSCYGKLAEGGDLSEVKRKRATFILLTVMVVAIAVMLTAPLYLPYLIDAFWQNGAGGR